MAIATLTKADGIVPMEGVRRMAVGASWDTTAGTSGGLLGKVRKAAGTDLDALAILMQGPNPVRFAGLDILDPCKNGSVVHSGDNRTGKGEGDDETIDVNFDAVPGNVDGMLFTAAAFKKYSSFENAANISFKVYTQGIAEDRLSIAADIWPSLLGNFNAIGVAKAVRTGTFWSIQVVDKPGKIIQGDRNSLLRFAMGF